VFSIQELQITF